MKEWPNQLVETFDQLREFPLSVPQIDTEPKHGRLARTVERNLRGDFGRFSRELGVRPGRGVFNLPVEDVARLCVADSSVLTHASPVLEGGWIHLLGQRFRKRDVSANHRRWCPHCLRETGAHHAWWDVGFVTTCPRHRCALVDSCPCGAAITWYNTPSFYFCACGRELAYAPTAPLAEDDCAFDSYVIGRMTEQPAAKPTFLDAVPMDAVVETCREIGKFALDPFQAEHPMAKKNGVRTVLNAGLAMVQGMPDSFRDLIEDIESDRPEQPPPAPVYSDEFRYWLVHHQPDDVDGNVSWHLNDGLWDRHADGSDAAEIPYGHFTYREAAEQCGISEIWLKAILRQMQARRRETALPLPLSLDPHLVHDLAADLRYGKTLQEISMELGVPSRDVLDLARRQFLVTVADREPSAIPCIIRGKAPDILMDWLRGLARADGDNVGVPLPVAAKARGISITDMVAMVCNGDARVRGVTEEIGLNSIQTEWI